MLPSLFESYQAGLHKRRVAAVWRGHGSTVFLEIGELFPSHRNDGSDGKPYGEYTIMIEWSWRIETEQAILAGSWSDEAKWESAFNSLVGLRVEDVKIVGRLPELLIELEGGRYVSSFMTCDGQPAWTLFKRSEDGKKLSYLSVSEGRVVETFD
ncbi:hypothetical protein [Rhizobium sp. SL86]|uniref:hypothetical protein n=1 Tax=Rhizobium sp. SL86 TaxID=2995148 RepID=UPI00227693DA|nr:hypothetical protein [Rhizobium sp. SL86]MCY1666179.1 hypothetical protein [Rhizobium sp. SL86]